ncbi:MAG TPA: hypothetical protein VF762_11005 [Blastocatellia bacterium]|jgi:hypothetical protein
MSEIETVKVENPAEPGGYMIINKSDLDENKHVLFGEQPKEPKQPKAPKGPKKERE